MTCTRRAPIPTTRSTRLTTRNEALGRNLEAAEFVVSLVDGEHGRQGHAFNSGFLRTQPLQIEAANYAVRRIESRPFASGQFREAP
jgi:hypothetical protein